MSYINIICSNHLDLTWRRPRYGAAHIDGYTLVPYSEIQEKQIDAGLDFARDGGCYALEQTISLREYLTRNPDTEPEIRQMIADGRLTVFGGGESIIDYNLPDGESIVRNHFYSRRYLKETFDYTPRLAACPDTFGMSAGLPTLFRALGYRGVTQFGRVFEQHKPIWEGISGDRVALDCTKGNNRPGMCYGVPVKIRVCGVCGGDGCPSCHGRGFAPGTSLVNKDEVDNLIPTIRECLKTGDFNIAFSGEETAIPQGMYRKLQELAREVEAELRFLCSDDLCIEGYHELLDNLDTAPASMVDSRNEGNPVASGCYTTRIKLKQENRRCEAALRTAETLCVEASLYGASYPAKTLERLWQRMAFIHFHDAIPSSHSDDAYLELMEECRQVRVSANRLIERAQRVLIHHIPVDSGEGQPFVVMNPMEFDIKNALLSASVRVDSFVRSGTVIASDGTRHSLTSITVSNQPEQHLATITFFGDLPAFGYGIFRFIPDEAEIETPEEARRGVIIENEFLRVVIGDHSVESVTDKRTGKLIALNGTFAPILSDDAGHAWGRMALSQYYDRADAPSFCENMMPALESTHHVSYCRRGELQIARIHITYGREEKQIKHLDWTCELILPDHSDELQVRIDAVLDARDIKLSTMVVLPEVPRDGLMDCEIPLGHVKRGRVDTFNDQLGFSDEWPCLRYVRADLGDRCVTLCNNGTPGHAIDRNILKVSLIRTPTLMCCGYGFKNVIDRSNHTFRFALSADNSPLEAYRRGMTLNAYYPMCFVQGMSDETTSQTGTFLRLPNNTPLLALKGAEDGQGFVCRYLGDNEPTVLSFDQPVTLCSLLEYEMYGQPAKQIVVPKFGLVTIRMKKDTLNPLV